MLAMKYSYCSCKIVAQLCYNSILAVYYRGVRYTNVVSSIPGALLQLASKRVNLNSHLIAAYVAYKPRRRIDDDYRSAARTYFVHIVAHLSWRGMRTYVARTATSLASALRTHRRVERFILQSVQPENEITVSSDQRESVLHLRLRNEHVYVLFGFKLSLGTTLGLK